jgi:hypothetical protein
MSGVHARGWAIRGVAHPVTTALGGDHGAPPNFLGIMSLLAATP